MNEPLPANVAANQSAAAASQEYQKFIVMNQQDRLNAANHMITKEKSLIMIGAAQINNSIDENIAAVNKQQQANNATTTNTKIRASSFVGDGDGFHNAKGIAKVIHLEDGGNILRLENFKSTNAKYP